MAYKVRITESARIDIDEIVGYRVDVLNNRTAASAFLKALDRQLEILSLFPLS